MLLTASFSLSRAGWIPCGIAWDAESGEVKRVESPEGFETWGRGGRGEPVPAEEFDGQPARLTAACQAPTVAVSRLSSREALMMTRRAFLWGFLFTMLAMPLSVEAQRLPEVRRIGYLHADLGGLPPGFYEILRDGLSELGHVEGRNLVIEHRLGDSRARLDELAA